MLRLYTGRELFLNSRLPQYEGIIECSFVQAVIAARGSAVASPHIGFED